MSQPNEYFPSYSFTQYQRTNPTTPLPAPQLDNELFEISTSINEICTNLALIQRDDGFLANQSVGFDQLTPGLALAAGVAQQWLTNTAYSTSNYVIQTGSIYKCAIAHTSGVFATDLAAGKWTVLTGANSTAMAAVISASTLAAARTAMGLGSSAVEALGGIVVDDGSGNLTIATSGITNSMMAHMNNATLKGNNSGSGANPSDLTASQVLTMLQSVMGQKAANFRNNQCLITSRGTSGTAQLSQDNYTLDGLNVLVTGATVTWSQGTQYVLPQYGTLANYLSITGNSSNTDVTVRLRMPGSEGGKYAGQRCTIQLVFTNGSGSSITPLLTVKTAGSLDNWSSPATFLNGVSMSAISSFGLSGYVADINANAYLGLEFDFDFGALNNNSKFLSITGFDIKITPWAASTGGTNTNLPPITVDDLQTDKIRNMAYLPSFGGDTGIIGIGAATSTSAVGFFIPFQTPTRVKPTGLTVTTVGDLEVTDMSGSDKAALTSLTFQSATKHGAFVTAGVSGTPLTSGTTYQLRVATALVGNLIFTGAEL